MSDLELLEMANHCKQVVEEKEKLIDFYKSKIENLEEDLRLCEYKIKQMEHLVKFKISECVKNEKKIFIYLQKDIEYLYNKVDNLRMNCSLDEEEDEQIVLMLQHIGD